MEINQRVLSSSGFYSCQYNNTLISVQSREAAVNVLKRTVAVEGIRVKKILSKLNLSSDLNKNQDNGTEINSQLENLIEAKLEQIYIKNVSNEEHGKGKITSILYGSNLTLYLQNYSWNDLMDKVITQRQNFLLRSALLQFHANNSTHFALNKEIYVIERGSMSIDSLEPLCPQGQSLTENGFICGKFRKRSPCVFSKIYGVENIHRENLRQISMTRNNLAFHFIDLHVYLKCHSSTGFFSNIFLVKTNYLVST